MSASGDWEFVIGARPVRSGDLGPSRVDHLFLAGTVKQAGHGQLADRALGRVEPGEVPRPSAGHFPDQLVHRQRYWVELQHLAKDRRLLALVFVMHSEDETIARALSVVLTGADTSCPMPPAVCAARGRFCRLSWRT